MGHISLTWEKTREEDVKFCNVFLLFHDYLPLDFGKRLNPDQPCFLACLVEISTVILEKQIFKFRQYIFAIS